MFRMRLAALMSGENISRDFEKHLQYSTSKRGQLQGFFSDNTVQHFIIIELSLSSNLIFCFLFKQYYQRKVIQKEAAIEPVYRTPLWKSRLDRIKRDGHHGHYDCGPNYFSVFPFLKGFPFKTNQEFLNCV